MGREQYIKIGLDVIRIVGAIIEMLRKRESRTALRVAANSARAARRGGQVGLILLAVCMLAGCVDLPQLPPDDPTGDVPAITNAPAVVPAWSACTKGSCWYKAAKNRNMNIGSPKMPDSEFRERVDWMLARGCNTAHLYVANQKDGECAGFCLYGSSWDWSIDKVTCDTLRDRIAYMRSRGLAVVIWCLADDSSSWNAEAAKDFNRYAADLKAQGLLDHASFVCAGLELNEYYKSPDVLQARAAQVKSLVAALRKVYAGKIATHETSCSLSFAKLADIVLYQVAPGQSSSWLVAEARRVAGLTGGRPVGFFEIERDPAREKCEALLASGACFLVGNW
ncbi:MAG: hypothetical protein PHR35_12605 [Kiritimatiellae bacterium]|nr:hypothetical protein [Kiritimatiellia bacterium]